MAARVSLVDPSTVAARKPGVGGVAIGLVLLAAFWILFGFGLGDATRFPLGQTYLPVEDYPANSTPTFLWAVLVGVFVGSTLGVFVQISLARRVSVQFAMGVVNAVGLLGTAVGFMLGARTSWVEPDRVGYSSTQGEPWRPGAWIGWTSQYWGPALLAIIAAVIVVAVLRGNRRRIRRTATASDVVTHGRKTTGTVTEAHDSGVRIMNEPRIEFTVKFADHRGIDRWVTQTRTFDWAQMPRVGDEMTLWFDPQRPDDAESIVVASGETGQHQ